MIKISIIIPAYNASKTILACLESIAVQIYNLKDIEVIVVDDGSTDDTTSIIKNYSIKSKYQIIFFSQKNSGPGIARNKALSVAKGDIIVFTDSDCQPDSKWLKEVDKALNEEPNQIIGGETFNNDQLIFPWKIAPVNQQKITANLATTKLALGKTRFDNSFKGLIGQDTDFVYRIEAKGIPYNYIKDMKVFHPANTLNYQGVARRAIARDNEVQLYKRYGSRASASVHGVFQPILFGRISLAFAVTFSFLVLFILSLIKPIAILGIIIILLITVVYFYMTGYKLFLTNMKNDSLSMTDKTRTLIYLAMYMPIFIYSRISGSIRFRYFIL